MDSIILYSLGGLALVVLITSIIIGWMTFKVFKSKKEKEIS